jgi:uncharacterized membrane protein
MAVKLQEIHPSLVHFPIALLPASIIADLLANVTGSRGLAAVGKTLMPVAAASAVLSAAAGLVAQQEVQATGEAERLLVTHRNMNLTLTAVSTLMAGWRLKTEEPGRGYLALGLAGLGALSYSAYLGGKMTYEHGLGVQPAEGLRDGNAPDLELKPGHLADAGRRAWNDLKDSVAPTVADLKAGNLAPAVGHSHENPEATPPGRQGAVTTATGYGAGGLAGAAGSGDAFDGAGAPETIP